MSTPAVASSSQNVTLPYIPELYNPNFLDVLLPLKATSSVDVAMSDSSKPSYASVAKNAMIDALKSTANRAWTDNGAPTHSSTGSATLDAFQTLTKYASGEVIFSCLDKAWREDPELTLRIIWNVRSIHDGKGEKEVFYQCFGWLFKNHPRTAVLNLPQLVTRVCSTDSGKGKAKAKPKFRDAGASHGYYKDLLNILCLATVDELGPLAKPATFLHTPKTPPRRSSNRQWDRISAAERIRLNEADPKRRERRLEKAKKHDEGLKLKGKEKRAQENAKAHRRLLRKLEDKAFRALYVMVARLFAERANEDIELLQRFNSLPQTEETKNERYTILRQITFAGKWAPTPGHSHDRPTNISTAISLLLHHSGLVTPTLSSHASPQTALNSIDTHILRSFYSHWLLKPLRAILSCPEPLMSANRWTSIVYSRVPSICMKNNMTHFIAHDPSGFEKYLTKVEEGKRSISGAVLMPHEIVQEVLSLGSDLHKSGSLKEDVVKRVAETRVRVFEAQWKTLIERLKDSGTLDNALAVCDVSGSMGSIHFGGRVRRNDQVSPILPAISLSLVLAQVAKPPFNNGFITFSQNPEYVTVDVEKDGLLKTIQDMSGADWGMNTDLHAVFVKLLLPLAVKNKIPQEDMIKRLFIFSDMQFDSASTDVYHRGSANWETNHDSIAKAYREAGYEMPQIVYWDLAAEYRNVPVESERKGVALMNGFSSAMLKVFMGEVEEEEVKMETESEREWEAVGADGESQTVVETEQEEEFSPINVMKKAVGRLTESLSERPPPPQPESVPQEVPPLQQPAPELLASTPEYPPEWFNSGASYSLKIHLHEEHQCDEDLVHPIRMHHIDPAICDVRFYLRNPSVMKGKCVFMQIMRSGPGHAIELVEGWDPTRLLILAAWPTALSLVFALLWSYLRSDVSGACTVSKGTINERLPLQQKCLAVDGTQGGVGRVFVGGPGGESHKYRSGDYVQQQCDMQATPPFRLIQTSLQKDRLLSTLFYNFSIESWFSWLAIIP
ncbi:hypothetical protein JAAARDRAFT_48320 [Jaapia argillacea MUCL 33604]|uniref:DUF2828 domain-containing protein n=1 Tax=Jaapia argillacea MUCL 33604 TaxID=933084 RepID=A0A067PNX4_9AGAM|nr:hypothetical protein JAAARDRAFT_48320 [Jaapia argillacea MUCL 33604]